MEQEEFSIQNRNRDKYKCEKVRWYIMALFIGAMLIVGGDLYSFLLYLE
ncbi:hypothetical protein [Neobacillus sp. LXY-1]